jgi:uncharacterized protein (TIGR01777 family)
MKIVIPGGTGALGATLVGASLADGHDVVVLSRGGTSAARVVTWDGRTSGPWTKEIDGADVVVNLAGRSVDCRYSKENLRQMMDSRVESTRAVGRAIAAAARPPRVWLQMSTATIYAHRFDAANDEATGVLGGGEPGAPRLWDASIDIAKAWERELAAAPTPRTRKVAMRTAMVMVPFDHGAFVPLQRLARCGLGGAIGGGGQFMSWIHDRDFVRAVLWLVGHEQIAGPVNLAAPEPLPQREFARVLRAACGTTVGVPTPRWMLEIGCFMLRTESELVLKSRRVVPQRLLDAGFTFEFPAWPAAARDLVARRRAWKRPA